MPICSQQPKPSSRFPAIRSNITLPALWKNGAETVTLIRQMLRKLCSIDGEQRQRQQLELVNYLAAESAVLPQRVSVGDCPVPGNSGVGPKGGGCQLRINEPLRQRVTLTDGRPTITEWGGQKRAAPSRTTDRDWLAAA